jgi:hypothetical protein
MPLLCPRLRCSLTELRLTSLCAGEILCLHAPAPLSKVRAIARAWISRVNGNFISSFPDSIGNKGARGLPSHLAPRPPPPPPSPPRLPGPNANPNPNQARAVGLPPDALEAAAAQLERREAVVREAERGAVRRVA